METNWIISLIVLVSSLAIAWRAGGQAQRSLRKLALGLAALDLLGMYFAPKYGGYVVGTLWALTFLIPGILQRNAQRAIAGQDYAKAERLMGWLAILRPFPQVGAARDMFRALGAAQQGDVESAQRLLEPLSTAPGTAGLIVRAQLLRIGQRWQELYALGFEPGFDAHAAADPSLAALWLRSLGECGLRAQLVHEWPRFVPLLSRPGLEGILDPARLMLFAFTGRTAAVAELLKERLPLMPPANAAFWRATAVQAAGDARPFAELAPAEVATGAEDVRRALAYRATRPPLPATPAANEDAVVETELVRLREDVQYAPAAMGSTDRAPVTRALIALIVLVFILEEVRGGSENGRVLQELGGMNARWVLETGEWWRIITYQLLHFGVAHIVMNALGLNLLGRDVERRLGGLRTAIIFFWSGAAGGLLSIFIQAMHWREEHPLVGASGGIMGFVGATIAIFFVGTARHGSERATRQLKQALTIVAIQSMFDLSVQGVSMMAHLSGVVAGFLVTLPMVVFARRRS
jgi:rhomboid protease GluP